MSNRIPSPLSVSGYCRQAGRDIALLLSYTSDRTILRVSRDRSVCRHCSHCLLYSDLLDKLYAIPVDD